MADRSIFDILGPVMIGPSSSHTAGAARIGRVAAGLAPKGFDRVHFLLHGSFAHTCRGHGTDRALIAGVLGMAEDDERIPDAFAQARARGLSCSFGQADLGEVHENSVKIEFHYPDGGLFGVTGSSLGGGQIVIIDIGGYPVSYTGSSPAVLVREGDKKGVVSSVSTTLANHGINIGTMSVVRKKKDVEAIMLIETDGALPDGLEDSLRALPDVFDVRIIPGGAI